MADVFPADRMQTSISSQLKLQTERSAYASEKIHLEKSRTSRSSSKIRSWSSLELKPSLSPSPSFLEPSKVSKDDTYIPPNPVTPKRPSSFARGLSLQMPARDITSSSVSNLTPNRIPSSPKLDSTISYGSTTSALPRRSRGMDFSRACTNLHHSTLAEQSSPDSSPTIGGRPMIIPTRKGHYNASSMSAMPDSPGSGANSLWSTMGNSDKTGVSSSVGSVNMMDSDTGSTSSDEDEIMGHVEDEDTIHGTPQARNAMRNPFMSGTGLGSGMDMTNPFSPSAANFMSFQRARLRNGRSRKSSSSVSGRSSIASPGPVSPPLLRSVESSLNGGYFPGDLVKKDVESRRESLSLGTNELQISDGLDSEDGESSRISPRDALGIPIPVTPTLDERRNVIRRAVTRRGGSLLPKPKNLARIRVALQEEGSPVDTEVKREAEVIRQVRESDNDLDSHLVPSHSTTTASSPTLLAIAGGSLGSPDDVPSDEATSSDIPNTRRSSSIFTNQAIKNSAGADYWNSFDERMRTPPPTGFFRGSSSSTGEDTNMDTPASSIQSMTPQQHHINTQQINRSRSSTPQPPSMAIEFTRKIGKRRRDDDLDPHCFKRRAVSPGVSLQNSPIMPSSPAQRDSGWWANQSKANRETPSGHITGERVNSGGNGNSLKRVGMQGMNDTNDGLMNMSIE